MKKIAIIMLCLLLTWIPALSESALPSVAKYAGGSISYMEAWTEYSAAMQTYTDFGWGADAADPLVVAQQVLESLVEDAVLYNKAVELGLTRISDDDMVQLRASAAETYENQISYYIDFYTSEGMTEADARAATEQVLSEDGITPESILAEEMGSWWRSALYDHVCEGLEIDESHILAYAEELAQTQALQFAADPLYFDYLYMNDDLIAYYPENLRYIKHILIGFDGKQAQAYQDLVGEGTQADADPDSLDAIYEPLADRVAEVEKLLLEGADFDQLMREYGADDFMLYEPYSITGYIVQPGSDLFVDEFVDACFALQSVGDISDPVRTAGGIHFILYAGDVPAGAVALESIAEAVAIEAQEQLLTDAYDAQVAAWMEEAQPEYHPEYLLQ